MKRSILLVGLAALVLTACSRISQKNYDKITNDMTFEQVQSILGKPSETSSMDLGVFSGGSATWKGKDAVITIQFVNGKVMTKTFSESRGE
jgi:hypothetical protein